MPKKEVQRHGFTWEKELITKVYGATSDELLEIKYNSKMDLPAKFNRLDNCDLSVKTSGNHNTVCMGDCLRVFDSLCRLVVIRYKQDDTTQTKKIINITELDLTDSRELLFGTLSRSQIEELDKAVKSVPQKRKPTPEEHERMYAIQKSLQALSGAIYLNIKCNSTQSRLQCSFNRFQDFIDKNEARVVATSSSGKFRGGSISAEIKFSRLVLKKKSV